MAIAAINRDILLHTDALYGVRFEGRNTSIVVNAEDRSEAIAKARKKKKRGGDKAVETWQLNETQSRQARAGRWVRTNSKGESRAKQGYRGVGPKPNAYRGDSEPLLQVVNLDARKVASSSGKIPGKRCKNAYIKASYKCSSHRSPDGKLTEEGKAAARELASKVRAQRSLKPKTPSSRQEVETQISNLEADLKKDNIPAPVKLAARKELKRLRSQLKDMGRKPDLKVIDGGKQERSLQDLFKDADRIGAKYQERRTEARRNLTQEFDNRIANIRKIKDPQKRYNAAQALQSEARSYSPNYSRDSFQGIRRKVSGLVRSTRQSAARKEGTQPTRSRAPYALPIRQAPTRVRAPDGRLLSIDSILNLDARKRKCLKPEDKDSAGRKCGKRARGFIGPQLPPKPKKGKPKVKSLSPNSMVKRERNPSVRAKKQPAELSNISHDYALSVSPRITKQSIDEAWAAIESEGARDRVNRIRNIIDKHEEKVFFTPESVRSSLSSDELLEEGLLSDFEKQIELFKPFEWNKAFDGLEPDDLIDFMSPSDNQAGFSLLGKEYKYTVVKIPEKSEPFKVDKELLNSISDSALNPPSGKIWWSNSQIARFKGDEDTAAFVTYLHESGHRIRSIAQAGGAKLDFKSQTKYGESNSDEWFAEHFTLWTLDSEAYRRRDPEGAKHIEEIIKLAEQKM